MLIVQGDKRRNVNKTTKQINAQNELNCIKSKLEEFEAITAQKSLVSHSVFNEIYLDFYLYLEGTLGNELGPTYDFKLKPT